MAEALLTTTGSQSQVSFADLGLRTFTHPTTDVNLLLEYDEEELKNSNDLQEAIDNGWVILTSGGAPISTKEVTDLEGAKLDVVYNTANYAPVVPPGGSATDLSAHLAGIDAALGNTTQGNVEVDKQDIHGASDSSTTATDWEPIPAVGGGVMKVTTQGSLLKHYTVIAAVVLQNN